MVGFAVEGRRVRVAKLPLLSTTGTVSSVVVSESTISSSSAPPQLLHPSQMQLPPPQCHLQSLSTPQSPLPQWSHPSRQLLLSCRLRACHSHHQLLLSVIFESTTGTVSSSSVVATSHHQLLQSRPRLSPSQSSAPTPQWSPSNQPQSLPAPPQSLPPVHRNCRQLLHCYLRVSIHFNLLNIV